MTQDTIEFRSEENGYNGWTNWATWNTALWIDNTPEPHQYFHAKAEQELSVEAEKAVERTAHMLEEAFTHPSSYARAAGYTVTDVQPSDWHEINWTEIAESLLTTVREYHEHGDTFLNRYL